ncbi:hypothetical protein B0H14DRAFT_2694368 [Mycena olivaceomarginata]|nr:hypothetical protein B0H14DRAFT_2694368 [Mycena olivaceomarginata]
MDFPGTHSGCDSDALRDHSTISLQVSAHEQRTVSHRLFLLLSAGLMISVSLNFATLYIWFYSNGPFNPLFLQALYCSYLSYHICRLIDTAQDVLEYKSVKFHSGFGPDMPIYDQPPSDEVDRAWEGLYEYQAVRLANKTYPILGDNRDVVHELHCLDEIRKAMYPDYYPHTSSEGINTNHMHHCLLSLRQSIMCTANISTIVWQWSEKSQAAKERWDILHTCRDFEKIQEWGKKHFAGTMQDMTIFIPDDLNIP